MPFLGFDVVWHFKINLEDLESESWRRFCEASCSLDHAASAWSVQDKELSMLWGGSLDFSIPLLIRKVFPLWSWILPPNIINPLVLILFSRVTRIGTWQPIKYINKVKTPVLSVKWFTSLESSLVGTGSTPSPHPFLVAPLRAFCPSEHLSRYGPFNERKLWTGSWCQH